MSNLSNDELIGRAGHAARNLIVLASLATFAAILLLAMAFHGGSVSAFLFPTGFTFCLIAAGYWTLMVAAKRGNPTSITIPLVMAFAHLTLALVLQGVAAAKNGSSTSVGTGIVIPVLVLIALHRSRSVLLELQDRGLWETTFQSVKPSGTLCLLGGILLWSGMLGFDGVNVYTMHRFSGMVAEERRSAEAFVNLIKSEEQDMMRAFESAPKVALGKAEILEKKLLAIQRDASDDTQLSNILGTYGNAVRQWKNGLVQLNQSNPDERRAQQFFKMGDRLREEAVTAFKRRYASQQAGM